MNKNLYFAAALVALASCSNDNFVGDNSPTMGGENGNGGAIVFNSGTNGTTRANSIGADAAALLHNRFVVGGFKTADASNYSKVFDNYGVSWQTNSAGTTASNTSDWEYVNVTKSPVTSITTAQTVKYWDYSTTSYDFIAYSTGAATEVSGTPSAGQVQVVAIDHANKGTLAYSLTGAKTDLKGCYIADLVTVNKADYGKEVQLAFRSLSSKVRMAIYETVPGYSVKDVKFYTQDVDPIKLGIDPRTSAATTSTAALIGSFANAGTYQVKFDGSVAHIAVTSGTNDAYATFGTFPATAIGTTSAAATYAPGELTNNYSQVLPNENGGVLELAVDYTLISDDGSDEEIKVYGATAYVPVMYSKWLANYAYTYIFKISDNTTGWTSKTQTDPKGLFPITFDAIVLDAEDGGKQATITNVATPSITTYQKNHDTTKDEYSAATGAIYVQVMDNNVSPAVLKDDLASKGQLYTLSAAKTEAEVMDALNVQVSSTETTITGRNGLVLTKAESVATITTIPGEDGNNITVAAGTAASFDPAAGTYAYVYDTGEYTGEYYATSPTGWPTGYYTNAECTTAATGEFAAGTYYKNTPTYIYTAVNTTSQPDDWATEGVWYKDPDGVTSAYSTTWAAGYYYKKYTVNHKVYGVKVIKVVN